MRKKPSFKEYLFTDYYVLSPLSSGVLLIIIGLYFLIFENNQLGLLGFGGTGVLVTILSIWRLVILKKLFTIGVEVKGKITSVIPLRRSYRVTLEYNYDDQEVKTNWIAVRSQKIRNLRNSSEINIIVNPNKTKQAVIMDVFN